MLRLSIACLTLCFINIGALAQAKASECLAIAMNLPQVQFVSLAAHEVRITYTGHSTFVIESPGGVKAATDYAGHSGAFQPDIVTMNRAHSSHFTEFPDPAIKHVLRGWSDDPGKRAEHDFAFQDMRVRNVTTDIRSGVSGRWADGNSIFIFETANLCIAHLGHLHHELTPEHKGWIGRLDVVMVAVDGGMTLPTENVISVLKDLNVRVVLPMHARFSGSLERFTAAAEKDFAVTYLKENSLVVSATALPERSTVFIMPGM